MISKLVKVSVLAVGGLSMMGAAQAADLVRADFHSPDGGPGVFDYSDTSETNFTCNDGSFDFLDVEDSGDDCSPDPGAQSGNNNSDVSGGGRWHMNIWGAGNTRGVTFNFSGNANAGQCADLATALDTIYGAGAGASCGCYATNACQFDTWIAADRLFKKGASSQNLGRFDIVSDGGPALRIDYHQPLSICADDVYANDRDWRVMQSGTCNGPAGPATADVIIPPTGGTGQDIVLGQWDLPFKVRAHRVPLPTDDGGGDPPACSGPDEDCDADGYTPNDGDCNDNDPNVHPGHNDTKGKWGRNGVDNDCDGTIDG